MEFEFDPAKDVANISKHGVSLAAVEEMEVKVVVEDTRYAEPRFRAYGLLDGKPYCFAFTMRSGVVRVISLRRSHKEEYYGYVD